MADDKTYDFIIVKTPTWFNLNYEYFEQEMFSRYKILGRTILSHVHIVVV